MIKKTKEVLKKLEFGFLEFFVGALMIIGLVGYFWHVGADLDWIDHTISFILFTYLFYKLNITSILFGKTSKRANAIIVISYFCLFFKDIISYSKIDALNIKFLTFVSHGYAFLQDNLITVELVSFYIGLSGLVFISIHLAKRSETSYPSFLYAIHPKKFQNTIIKFLAVWVLLLGFYFLIYNNILEHLEFVLDDPIVAVGIIYYVYHLSKHHIKFHKNNFVFKIGDFSTRLYRKFVSLFHYKKTIPLGISGLVVLFALSDLSVFSFSLIFFKQSFYFELLEAEHIPFLMLFLKDAASIPSFAVAPLFVMYLLNALSLIIFLLIPVLLWVMMFSNRQFHFSKKVLFIIYASISAYILLPGYWITPLYEKSLAGVDINSISLLKGGSVLNQLIQDKAILITVITLISVTIGAIAYLLSNNAKIRKGLFTFSIIGGLLFYSVYLYYFFRSLSLYFYQSIGETLAAQHIIIALVLIIFLMLSVLFFVGGYSIFIYEIIMDYHKHKWSEPRDKGINHHSRHKLISKKSG